MSKKKLKRQGEAWSREEIRALKAIFRNHSNANVAEKLDRSPKSIERKAAKLGLRKTKKYLKSIGHSA